MARRISRISAMLPTSSRGHEISGKRIKEESILEGFVVPGWGRLGAAGPVEIVSDCHVVAPRVRRGPGPASARPERGWGRGRRCMETTPPRPRSGAGARAGEEEAGASLIESQE